MQFSSFSAGLPLSPQPPAFTAAAFPFVVCGCLIDINFPLGGRPSSLPLKALKRLLVPSPRLTVRGKEGGRPEKWASFRPRDSRSHPPALFAARPAPRLPSARGFLPSRCRVRFLFLAYASGSFR